MSYAQIHVGQWAFFPEMMVARNMHNGVWAWFTCGHDGTWNVTCVNCPAVWMLTELAEWFAKWIAGRAA